MLREDFLGLRHSIKSSPKSEPILEPVVEWVNKPSLTCGLSEFSSNYSFTYSFIYFQEPIESMAGMLCSWKIKANSSIPCFWGFHILQKLNLWRISYECLTGFRQKTGAWEENFSFRVFNKKITRQEKRKKGRNVLLGARIKKQNTKSCSTSTHRVKTEPVNPVKIWKVWSEYKSTLFLWKALKYP